MRTERTLRPPVVSFIVRVWTSNGEGVQARGEIEHIRTGERRAFNSYQSMLDVMDAWRQETAAVG